jgi:hypothetical protein
MHNINDNYDPMPISTLHHLNEIQFHRCRTTEDAHNDPQFALLRLHLIYDPVKIGKGTIDDPDMITHIKLEFWFGLQRPLVNPYRE